MKALIALCCIYTVLIAAVSATDFPCFVVLFGSFVMLQGLGAIYLIGWMQQQGIDTWRELWQAIVKRNYA